MNLQLSGLRIRGVYSFEPCYAAFHDMDDFVPHTLHLFSSKSKRGRGSCQNRTIVRSGGGSYKVMWWLWWWWWWGGAENVEIDP